VAEKPENVLAVEGDEEFVECPECEGAEGSCDERDNWHPCLACNGEGGFWRTRRTDS
jgi:hypothetical protein